MSRGSVVVAVAGAGAVVRWLLVAAVPAVVAVPTGAAAGVVAIVVGVSVVGVATTPMGRVGRRAWLSPCEQIADER